MKKTISAFMILILTASLFAASAAALPDKYRTDAETPVLNQKNNPLCWAYAGADMLIINGNDMDNIERAFNGEDIGTLFSAHKKKEGPIHQLLPFMTPYSSSFLMC